MEFCLSKLGLNSYKKPDLKQIEAYPFQAEKVEFYQKFVFLSH